MPSSPLLQSQTAAGSQMSGGPIGMTDSTQTAKEMASGALAAAKADVAVSITGIAGPDGGTARKPVGLVYIGCSVQGHTIAQEYRFSGNREKIRDNAVSAALTLTRRCILENCSKKE